MTDKNVDHGLWAATAPAAPTLTPFKGDKDTDVAIIGGGFTGLSAALYLAESGTDALLLESRHVGFGGSGRNVGLVNAGLWLPPEDVIKIVGNEHGENLVEFLGKSPDMVYELIEKHQISCEAIRVGTLHCGHSPAGLKSLEAREAQWQKRGAPVKLLSQEETTKKTGSNKFCGALLDERAGTVQPLSYVRGLAHAAVAAGANLFDNSPVTGLEKKNGRWELTTPGGTIRAKSVILATQGYPEAAFENKLNSLIPFNYFQFATPPLSDSIREKVLCEGHAAWDTALILSSYRFDDANRFIVGSVGQVINGGFNVHESWARRTIRKVFPAIPTTELEYAWGGRIAMTTDHIPRFHMPDESFVTVTSYNGRGIGPGTVFGKLMAQLVNGEVESKDVPLPLQREKAIFMRNLRGLFYETGARLYHTTQRRI
ncbi:Glycine/D-amino acid oxidase [Desulfocicer vacuolatum DSM 3385]|uniref:Glycine/D-amino acid oxidase n=1 Tax=Desulfocicer vacuolatum DSM 3385 TaxID=1121400 RepID=A0A1W2EGV3_9BACT|nr:FAD-binding oxidoreductase [Desulfocicer vacuolatum]SMD08672.1 Glycine/D-amino acid oxidase [Desulfocicer vacuolatum DSM 3385]